MMRTRYRQPCYQLGPPAMGAIHHMKEPMFARKLCQFIHYCRRMSTCIRDFNRSVQVFNVICEKAYLKVNKRRMAAPKSLLLTICLGTSEYKDTSASIQHGLHEQVKLAFRKSVHVICMYTNVSETMSGSDYSGKGGAMKKGIEVQQHEPLAFLGGPFASTQKHWSI